jgi:hypothetical protein
MVASGCTVPRRCLPAEDRRGASRTLFPEAADAMDFAWLGLERLRAAERWSQA